MKKSIFAVALLLGSTSVFAQEEKQYLPQADDWAIGIDANPFLSYFGNFIGGTDANAAPAWNFLTNNQTITGKLFVSETMAYRGSLRLGFGSSKSAAMVNDDAITTAPTFPALSNLVEDEAKMGGMNIGLSGGLEMRRGHGRLQGFYGGELGLSFSSTKDTYTYGNAMSITGASTNDFGSNMTTDTYGNTARITENKSGMMMTVGLRGFIGAEYFIFPMISVGGEFGWGLAMTSQAAGTVTAESTDGASVGVQAIEGSKSGSFGFDTDNLTGVFGNAASLRMTFHF